MTKQSHTAELELPKDVFYRSPLLTDMYQLTMMYAYFKNQMHQQHAVFELFFRKCPFSGEYTIFAGLRTALEFLQALKFSDSDIAYVRKIIPQAEDEFFTYLRQVDASQLNVYSLREGTICFPNVPLLIIEGPLAVAQLIETSLLNIIGFPTLVCTNATRMRVAAGQDKVLMEFGLRRAQAADGGMSASLYAIMGGFDKTSNVLAGKEYNIEVSGTHAHAFVMSFSSMSDVKNRMIKSALPKQVEKKKDEKIQEQEEVNFVDLVWEKSLRIQSILMQQLNIPPLASSPPINSSSDTTKFDQNTQIFQPLTKTPLPPSSPNTPIIIDEPKSPSKTKLLSPSQLHSSPPPISPGPPAPVVNEGELAAFTSYAVSFPYQFCALVDTYNTLRSGVPNFLSVASTLLDLGYPPSSIRLDSGDLAYLSKEAKKMFNFVADELNQEDLKKCKVVASNDINEDILYSLKRQDHQIDIFGIGTNLVTCQKQPALGCVYKLVELEGKPRIKISNDVKKTTLPCKKFAYRLLSAQKVPLLDVIIPPSPDRIVSLSSGDKEKEKQQTNIPQKGKKFLCCHPYEEKYRSFVQPFDIISLHNLVWSNGHVRNDALQSVHEVQAFIHKQITRMRTDHLRPDNPTPYKVSVTQDYYNFMHQLIEQNAPIETLND